MAKDKLMRGVRTYIGGYDLSGDVRTFGSLDHQAPEVMMTGLSDTVENFLAEHKQVGVRGYQVYLNDAAGGASAVMAAQASHVVTVAIGSGGAAPVAGDMAYIIPGVQLADSAEFGSSVGMFTTDLPLNAGVADENYKAPWGKVLMPLTTITGDTDGASVDFGAAGTAGAHATLHITASAAGGALFTIEGSTSGAFLGEETTLLTFAANGSAVTAEWKSVSGAAKRYNRINAGSVSGSITFFVSLAKN